MPPETDSPEGILSPNISQARSLYPLAIVSKISHKERERERHSFTSLITMSLSSTASRRGFHAESFLHCSISSSPTWILILLALKILSLGGKCLIPFLPSFCHCLASTYSFECVCYSLSPLAPRLPPSLLLYSLHSLSLAITHNQIPNPCRGLKRAILLFFRLFSCSYFSFDT